jgi:hypothetical protein
VGNRNGTIMFNTDITTATATNVDYKTIGKIQKYFKALLK